jgi:Tfp pilus assembly protein PilX
MKLLNQRGVVSLLAVSLMSILILILTVGMIRLMSGELSQATDSADSVKAYYTAQGAAENAAQQLRTKLETTPSDQLSTLDQGCVPPAIPPYTLPTESAGETLDCVQVAANLNTVSSTVDENTTRTFDLTNSVLTDNGYITRLVLSWDDNSSAASGVFTSGTDALGATWLCAGTSPPSGCTNQPPVMKLGVTNYYPGQNTNVNTQYSGELILSPECVTLRLHRTRFDAQVCV